MSPTNYSKIYRIMHWLIAAAVIFILITILLRLTWMNKNGMAEIIQNYATENNITLGEKDASIMARQIRTPMWNWHVYLGYVLVGLFAVRFILPFFGEMKIRSPFKHNLKPIEKFQFWTYIIFYLCISTSLITGLIIEFGPKSIKHTTEEIHELSIYYLVAFLIIHFGGVLLSEFTDKPGIISRIVRGKNSDS